MLAIIAAEALFSITYLLGKLALADGNPFFLSAYRTMLGSLILLMVYYFVCDTQIKITRSLLAKIILMAFFYNFLAVGARFWGLQYVPIAKASLIYNMSPFLTVILSSFIFKHRLTHQKLLGLIVGFIGFIPVFYNSSPGEQALFHISFFSSAELLLVVASLSAVLGNILFKHVMEFEKCHFLFASSISMFIGSVFHLLTSLLIETWHPLPVSNIQGFFFWATLLTLSSNVISYAVYGKLLRKYTVSLMAFAGMLVPLFSALSGMIFLAEPFQWYIIPSLSLISLGLYIFYRQERELGYLNYE